MDTRNVLIIEDDSNITELLTIHLSDLGCKVVAEKNGQNGLERALDSAFELIILDVMLPGMNGMEVCRKVRQNDRQTPIMMLTARSEEIDKVMGLETGADDYLTKPFSIREFIARVRVIFRRSEEKARYSTPRPPQISIAGLEIDIDKRKVMLLGERIELSPREFELIVLLASNPGRSYSRKQLLSLVWGYDFEGYEHTVNTHINRLRGKIEVDVSNPSFVLTTWGIGYRFNEDL
ncbi:response regulator transcription factor [Dyadobacter fanqingshengii]|uniref:Phosphate regulon transcriptional regulatory protein PhoB n=1 Tax=Dyadobacter fanqingshengii TaxID=2906443 RepID=A0A9X1PCR2_9BACT|nr:response regulator transcription factor [Dyadobacter fanqingshengii]MCF0042137.1 response regulator transcription factor [Dyadobacter fanqingshengii]MCF2506327.1 response regulator transcription factor [Dyadobacter fanqingshengii]USJ35329.1 response regulator transcription factor [Dyadobacter fanqingshengii]